MEKLIIRIGVFTYNTLTDQVTGPQDYMDKRFKTRMKKIQAGTDSVFNFGSRKGITTKDGQRFDVASLVLISLQTDYAAHQGMKSFSRGVTS